MIVSCWVTEQVAVATDTNTSVDFSTQDSMPMGFVVVKHHDLRTCCYHHVLNPVECIAFRRYLPTHINGY